MGGALPDLDFAEFSSRLRVGAGKNLGSDSVQRLHLHFKELRKWNVRYSLVGPGTGAEFVERHYVESLAALPFLARDTASLVDIGSGAGFPGWVLAAVRTDLDTTLVESSEKKCAFLATASRRALLSCRHLNARVGASLPAEFPGEVDIITSRAVKLSTQELLALASRLSEKGSILLWAGKSNPDLPRELSVVREVALGGSVARRILVVRRATRLTGKLAIG